MQRALLDALGAKEEITAVDSTGYRDTSASAYSQTRKGRTYRSFLQGGYAVGCESQLILACREAWGPGNDPAFLRGLRKDARRYGGSEGSGKSFLLLGDRGFDGGSVREGDLIPPIRRGGSLLDPERIERKDRVEAARLDGIYGQRWKCETVHSVIKRKRGTRSGAGSRASSGGSRASSGGSRASSGGSRALRVWPTTSTADTISP